MPVLRLVSRRSSHRLLHVLHGDKPPVPAGGGLRVHIRRLGGDGLRPGHEGRRAALGAAAAVPGAGRERPLRPGARVQDRLLQDLPQLVQPPAAPGGGADHRTAQLRRQHVQVHPDALLLRLVQQVHAKRRRPGNLQNLQRQGQVPLQAGGVRHHQRHVRLPAQQVVPGDLLLGGAGVEGVGPRQVHQGIGPAVICIRPPGGFHRLAGPVSGVLAQVGQRVEYGGFPHVGVAHQGDHRPLPFGSSHFHPLLVLHTATICARRRKGAGGKIPYSAVSLQKLWN